MRFSTVLFLASLAFAAGIFFASFLSVSLLAILFAAAVGAFFFAVFFTQKNLALAGVVLVVFSLGMLHQERAEERLFTIVQEQKGVSLEGIVEEVRKEGGSNTQLVFYSPELSGKALLYVDPFEGLSEGDAVRLAGDLELPPVFEDFDWRAFLLREGIAYTVYRPEIELLTEGRSFLFEFRERMKGIIHANLPMPQSSILAAVLLGFKAELPEELKDQLNSTGTRHITAISGMHVSIVMLLALVLFLRLGLWRRQALFLSLLFIIFFIILSGMQISALRAGFMGGAVVLGAMTGRKNAPLRSLVFAGAALLLFNPLLLYYDAGFQLSFFAVLGILLFLPVLQHFLRSVPNVLLLRDILAMSIAAQFFTLPLILFHFGTLSFVSLFANLLIVPLLPFILALGIVFLAGTLLLPFLGVVFSFPVALLLSYLSFVVEQLSHLPFAATQVSSFPAAMLFPLYAAASFLAWRFQQDKRFQFREQTMLG